MKEIKKNRKKSYLTISGKVPFTRKKGKKTSFFNTFLTFHCNFSSVNVLLLSYWNRSDQKYMHLKIYLFVKRVFLVDGDIDITSWELPPNVKIELNVLFLFIIFIWIIFLQSVRLHSETCLSLNFLNKCIWKIETNTCHHGFNWIFSWGF